MPVTIRRFVSLALAILMLGAAPGPATAAAPQWEFPTQSLGNRGENVRAIQGFLVARGETSPLDGVFGTETAAAVASFQVSRGLSSDGVVDGATWWALVVPVRGGSSGEAVTVLQRQLNAKRKAGLSVDGVLGPATRTAVRAFRSHVGMRVTSAIKRKAWRRVIAHFELPRLKAHGLCDYSVGNGAANWGTSAAIAQIEAAGRAFAATDAGRVPVGDVSREHGGDIPLHGTHAVGLDVDLRLIRDARDQCRWGTRWQWSTYDRAATRAGREASANSRHAATSSMSSANSQAFAARSDSSTASARASRTGPH